MRGESMYTRDNLPEGDWGEFRKTTITRAMRMDGPFECVTSDGNTVRCEDGWLMVDSEGYPYPCDAANFAASYVPVGDGKGFYQKRRGRPELVDKFTH